MTGISIEVFIQIARLRRSAEAVLVGSGGLCVNYFAVAEVAVTQNDTPDRSEQITPDGRTVYCIEFI